MMYMLKVMAAFVRSKLLKKNTVWPTRPTNDVEALARLSEDFQRIFAEAEGFCEYADAHDGKLIFGDAEDTAHIKKMRARLAMLK